MKARYIVAEKPKEETPTKELMKQLESGIDYMKKHGFEPSDIDIKQNIIPDVNDVDSYIKYKKTEEIRLRINARLSRKPKVERK